MKRPFRNIIMPVLILAPLIGLMVGCIYIPTWKQPVLIGTRRDFRAWAKEHGTNGHVTMTNISRTNVEAMFGTPRFKSKNGKVAAYVMQTVSGVTIFPQCFGGGFNEGTVYAVKIFYDDSGRAREIDLVSDPIGPPMYEFFTKQYGSPDEELSGESLLREWNYLRPEDEQIQLPKAP